MQARKQRRRSRTRRLETLEKRNLLFAPTAQLTLVDGLESVSDALDRVEAHAEYAESIPGLERSAGSIADLSETVREGLVEPLQSLFDGTSDSSANEIVAALDGYSSQAADVSTLLKEIAATEINNTTEANVQFTATIEQTRTSSVSLGAFGDASWLSWNGDAPIVEVLATTEASLTFGVDLISQEFFTRIGEVTTEIEVDADPLAAEMHAGPVAVNLVEGAIQFDGQLVADFGDALLTKDDLAGSLDGVVSVSANGSLSANLPVAYSIGDFSGSETITWDDASIFDGEFTLPQFATDGDLINAVRVDAEDLAGFFSLIGTKLDELLAGGLPNWSEDFLPWVRGLQLPELSQVSERISEFTDEQLQDDDGRASFRTFEDLSERLAAWTNREALLNYLPSTSELTIEFVIPASLSSGSIPMGVDQDFDPLSAIDVTGTASASGEMTLSGVFGVDLTALQEDTTPDDVSDDDSWADHFFVDELKLDASVNVATENASAGARFGFIEAAIGSVVLEAEANASLEFSDSNEPDGRISFRRLSEAVVTDPTELVADSNLDGSAELLLTQMTVDGIPGLEMEGGEIQIGLADITDPASFTFEMNDAVRNINSLASVTTADYVELIGNVIEMLDDLTASAKWDEPLPGIDASVNELLDVTAKLQQAAEELLEADESSIQALGERLETLLEDALSLDPSALDVLLSWETDSLEMTVQFDAEVQSELALSVDISELIAASNDQSDAFDLVTEIVDVSGASMLDVSATLSSFLTFGVDVGDVVAGASGATPEFFVGDQTGLEATLKVDATDLDTNIAVGPLGLFVVDGTITLDADGDSSTAAPALLSAGLAATTNGRYANVTGLSEDDVESTFDAGASIVLPLYFPTEAEPVGGTTVDDANALIAGIGNLAGLFNSEDPEVALQGPDLNALINDFDPLEEGVRALAEGLDALLQKIEILLREQVLNQNLPMVGERLEAAADFLKDVREQALPILRDRLTPQALVDEIKLVLHDALGSVMRLSDSNADGNIDHLDIDLAIDAGAGTVELQLPLGGDYSVAADIDFDLGLPALGLELDGGVVASLDWAIDIGVGINPTDGFYVDTTHVNEIELSAEVTLPSVELTGSLGLFQVTVTDQGSQLSGDFAVDLREPSGDGKWTTSELVAGTTPLADLVDVTLTGGASVNLGLVAGTTLVQLPELHADLVLDWEFGGSNLAGSIDRLAIENIELDLGSFITGFAGDILGKVQEVLAPIQPIVDVLTAPLPVANDLEFLVDTFAAETTPNDAVNLLDFASLLGNVDVDMLDAIVQIVDLVNSVPVPAAGESVMIPLGEIVLIDGTPTDPSGISTNSATVNEKDLSEELDNYSGSEEQERFASESASFLQRMSEVKGGGFQFPILQNPASLIGVMLGQDATLFAYQTPRLSADFSMGVTIPITGPLAIEFVGGIGVDAQFSFGYDTLGLRNFIDTKKPEDLLDGFFVSDRENVDGTGSDVDEVTLRGSLEAFATITTGVASVSVGGGIYATVGANLHDNNHDGKVRVQEILENLPLCVFDFNGSLSAGLRVKAQVLGVPFSEDIARVRLLEFGTSCVDADNLSLGELDSDGVYRLFAGDTAHRREVGQGITDEYATFSKSIDEDGNEVLEVSAFGVTETVRGVTQVIADGGDGDDTFIVYGDLDIPVNFIGGSGDDELIGGSGADVLLGGGGDDLIQGNDGSDTITGGSGNDVLEGGEGNDDIRGGDRDDYILGGAGNDVIDAGHGQDIVFGGRGMDRIDGDIGNDELYGDEGTDIINAGEGNDVVEGGPGDDSIHGNDGDDVLHGNSGDDFVHGGDGQDEVNGNAGNDILYGGYEEDVISGGLGSDVAFGGNEVIGERHDNSSDIIRGGDDNDFLIGDDGEILDFDGAFYVINVLGGSGADHIEAGDGDDWVHGVGGDDTLFGESGNDHVIGGEDADQIFGQDGNDWLEGGLGDDFLEGNAGNDWIGGGRGADWIDGGADGDELHSHDTGGFEPWHVSYVETEDDGAEDVIFGRGGNDEIIGGIGNDLIDAGTGADGVIGGLGDDRIDAGLGNDEIDVSFGSDTVVGQWGDDTISVGSDLFERIDGQHGAKTVAADQFSNDATNQLVYRGTGATLDLADAAVALKLSDIDRINAESASGFRITLDRKSVVQITDESNTLRLDLNGTADASLDGEWQEQGTIQIDGVTYRRLTSGPATLVVTDLKTQHNGSLPHDVNGDGEITPLDALLVINAIGRGKTIAALTPDAGLPQWDVNGDNLITPVDALRVINEIGVLAGSSAGRPKSEGEMPPLF
ncbi:MAG: dockerin type I domain-containing protein [Planctomycetota bacterium]